MKLLLVNPRLPESFWGFTWAFRHVARDKRAAISPLGLATVAEGIENLEVWRAVEQLSCTYGQGYYISRPLPAGEIASLLGRRASNGLPLAG